MEVKRIYQDGSSITQSYQARGHHDARAFVAALEEQHWLTCDPNRVRHEHMRVVPCGEEGGLVQIDAAPGKPGAFPVTEVWVEYTEDITPEKAREA